jgi:hypothetical protein
MSADDKNENLTVAERSEPVSNSSDRRDALKKIAIYSAYTAPVMLALMKPAKAQISSLPQQ